MAALVENMMYVGSKPWHGLGVELDAPPSSKDAIVAGGLDWIVESRPIFDANGNEISNYKANVRNTDDSVLGIVSNRYSIVQNSEAFDFTDSLLDEGMVYETCGSLRGGKQIWLLGKMPETKILDDSFEQYVCFTNTHDGEGSIRVLCTPIRVVCNNTLNLALNSAKRSWSTRHIGDLQSKLAEAQSTLGLISAYTKALDEEANKLVQIGITDAEVENMLDFVYAVKPDDSDIRKAKVNKLKDNFFTCMTADNIKQYRGTAWGVVNAVTDFADHSEPMRRTSNFEESRWGQIMVGHPFVDQMYKQIQRISA